jgi:hypothetical protein
MIFGSLTGLIVAVAVLVAITATANETEISYFNSNDESSLGRIQTS